MPILESAHKWSFSSTGTGKFQSIGASRNVTFGAETSSGSTATVQILHRMGSTLGKDGVLSTVACTAVGALVTAQLSGPLDYIAPRVVDKTAGGTTNTVTVYVRSV